MVIYGILIVFTLCLILSVPFTIVKHLRGEKGVSYSSSPMERLDDRVYNIFAFAFPGTVQSIDDLTAQRFNQYREMGSITDLGREENLIFQRDVVLTADSVFELGDILISAKEVQRLNDVTAVYFFDRLEKKNYKSELAYKLHHVMTTNLSWGNTVLIRVNKLAEE